MLDGNRSKNRVFDTIEGNIAFTHRRIQGQAAKIKQPVVAQMGWHHILQGRKYGLGTPGVAAIPVLHHFTHLLSLQIFLGAAQIARNQRIFHGAGEFGDITFGTIRQRPDHDMRLVVGHQLGRHGFHLAAKQQVEKQGMHHVIAMVAKGNLVCTQLFRRPVNDAPAQAGAQRTRRLACRNLVLDDGVGIRLDDAVLNTQRLEITR